MKPHAIYPSRHALGTVIAGRLAVSRRIALALTIKAASGSAHAAQAVDPRACRDWLQRERPRPRKRSGK